jgi:hypothetical protein
MTPMTWSTIGTIVAIIVGAGAILRGCGAIAGAILRALPIWQNLTKSVETNTQATGHLTSQFEQYKQVTDRRLEILEEVSRAHQPPTLRRWL